MDVQKEERSATRLPIWICLVVLCIAYALSHSYSSMATYDDESYVMMTIKTFLEGDRLYAETFTQYGPAYYMLQQPIHDTLGIPLTHDVVRLKTIFFWMLLASMSGVLVYRMTDSSFAGSIAALMTVVHLENYGLEPAHPQEVVAVLVMLGLLLMNGKNHVQLVAAGVLVAFAALSKLNVGAIAAISLLCAASYVDPRKTAFSRVAFFATSLLAMTLASGVTFAVAQKSGAEGELLVAAWPLVVLVSVALLSGFAWKLSRKKDESEERSDEAGRRWPVVLSVVLGGTIGSVVPVAWALTTGNTFDELLYGIVLQHAYMSREFYNPVGITLGALTISVIAGALMLTVLFDNNEQSKTRNMLRMFAPFLLFVSVALCAVDCWKPLEHGLTPRGAAAFLTVAGPILMPLLIIKKVNRFRMALAMIACLSPLMSFPVPGTQVALGSHAVLLGLIAITFDLVNEGEFPKLEKYCHALRIAVALVLLVSTVAAANRWVSYMPVDQPGCRWLRLSEDRVVQEQRVTESIRNADSDWLAFETLNCNRYYLWTDKKPLTSMLPSYWPIMLTEEQLNRMESAAREKEKLCVVKIEQDFVDLDEHAPRVKQALLDGWQMVEQIGSWQIGVRTRQ